MVKSKLISISELTKKLNIRNKKNNKPSSYTLRFWEKEFKQIKPIKLNGNRRYYDEKNVNIIKLIQYLLKEQGLTIAGVKKIISKNVNSIDDYKTSSIKAEYFRNNVKIKTKNILDRIKKIKNG
jgi:DNA-binding transcriptional MerR regulator